MRLGNNRIGLLGFLLVMILSAVSTYLKGPSSSPKDGGDVSVRRPLPTPPPGDLAGLPEFSVEIGEKADGRGTAFAIGSGFWMTARHVVDSCDVVGILERPRRGLRARSYSVHRSADVAVMRIDRSAPPVRFADAPPQPGDIAYHVGFPRGKPGELRSRMLGLSVMNARGRYSTREPVIAWAELERFPEDSSPLSGISGGPVFDSQGRLIGVHVAGSVRRGRSFTAHPSSIREMVDRSGAALSSAAEALPFTPDTLPAVADALRDRGTVAMALCDVR
ncbi:Trypsin-like peptidase domain-containing protein [Thalassobaculum litoreum DSM 18839]|uniref:Serine protease n=1 Tax=Thalassobaculum litoreum DSM 18839 TaxID=1123362 RepID=A0A8G2BMZ0_9PROT|nr:Trypsin-like peptidase domain-containing protein [Thalassobaculum litoreum DSM 18839]